MTNQISNVSISLLVFILIVFELYYSSILNNIGDLMDLTNFLRTGMYLKLKVGLAEEDIYSYFKKKDLGKKHYFDKLNKNRGFSYFFKALQIRIINFKIYSLGFDLTHYPVSLLDNIILYPETSFELILNYLDIANIEWSVNQQYCCDRVAAIQTEGNVLISCIYEKGNYCLSKFQTL